MYLLLWDASALAQRYAPELGSPTVNALFAAVPRAQMITTILTYSETFAALLRKFNRGVLDQTAFTMARSALRASSMILILAYWPWGLMIFSMESTWLTGIT